MMEMHRIEQWGMRDPPGMEQGGMGDPKDGGDGARGWQGAPGCRGQRGVVMGTVRDNRPRARG